MVERLGELHRRVESEAAARVAVVEKMRHNDRLATVGTLAAGIAHELGTPLHIVAGRANRIATAQAASDDVRAEAESIRSQCERMRIIVEQLLTFARKPSGQPSTVSLQDVARRVTAWLTPVARKKSCELSLVPPSADIRCIAHVGLIEQALTNITVNALQAVGEDGIVRVAVREEVRSDKSPDGKPQKWAVLEVRDNGSGRGAQQTGIGHEHQAKTGGDGACQKKRLATTETVPGAVRIITDNGLHDHTDDGRHEPEIGQFVYVGAIALQYSAGIAVLERKPGLYAEKAKTHVPDVAGGKQRLGIGAAGVCRSRKGHAVCCVQNGRIICTFLPG